jgi:uncharacterized protein YggE
MSSSISISVPLPGARARWVAGGLVAGLLAAALTGSVLGPRPLLATDPASSAEHTISVNGTGRVVISPDVADLRIGVVSEASTVGAARDAAAAAMTGIIDRLRQLRIADRDIQTTTLSLSPVYDYRSSETRPHITGYSLANMVAVTIRDLDVVGDAIDGAVAAGATSIDGISFRASDQAAAEKQARETAMAEAKAKAQTLASAAGVSITGVAAISESVSPTPYPVYYGAPTAEDAARTPIEAGSNEVSVTVSVVYLIG